MTSWASLVKKTAPVSSFTVPSVPQTTVSSSASSACSSSQASPKYDYLAVLDFEATCWKDSNKHEIIEFPTVLISVRERKIVDRIEQFVLPTFDPTVSKFCYELTTITQAQVNGGISLAEALNAHIKFLSEYPNVMFVTCGDWDLKTMLVQDAARNKLKLPSVYNKWINIKHVFERVYRVQKAGGMPQMLKTARLSLQGTHHRGIDDCNNIARIALHLMDKVEFDESFVQTRKL